MTGQPFQPSKPKRNGPAVMLSLSPSRESVTLCKGGHRWTFSCEPDGEKALLLRLAELARAEDVPFDWFDAALVSHQLRNRLLPGLARQEPTGTSSTAG